MIKIYRKGNFTFSHERADLRKISSLLSEKLRPEEDIYIFANVELPSVTYTWGVGENKRERTYSDVSPDLIVMKKDSIAVVEMKSYPGLIKFPLAREEVFNGEWSSKLQSHPEQIINEGRGNPYSQVDNNRKAVVAYLREKEEEFSSEECKGSNWDKALSFILLTHNTVEFEHAKEVVHEPGNWYHSFHLGSLSESNNGEYFPHFIKDMTTGPRLYKSDERSEISISDNCIEKLSALLGCNDVTSDYINDEKDLSQVYSLDDVEVDNPIVTSGVGFAPTLVHGIVNNEDEDLKESFKPSPEELALPRELRLLAYYRRCLMEESKYEMKIWLETRTANEKRFILDKVRETIFFKNKPMKIPDDVIHELHTNMQRPDPSLSYGFSLLIDQIEFNDRHYWIGEPLFITRVNFNKGSYEIAYENDIMVNQAVLSRIPPFDKLDHTELLEKIDNIFNEDARPAAIIENIFKEMGLLETKKIEELMILQGFDSSSLEKGFRPSAGLIYRSESGIYNSLLKELRIISQRWKEQLDNNEIIGDLAYRLLNGLQFKSDDNWNIPLYNVGHSNYEQSKSIGIAMNNENPITVVSGPPGTGKSQLATNLISEMNRNSEKVIFSSRNNKAIDVIVNRYNTLFATTAIERVSSSTPTIAPQPTSKYKVETLNKRNKTILTSKVMNNNKELNNIKNNIEEYIAAVDNIEKIDNEIQNILQENPKIQLIDWYIDDGKKLNLKYWEKTLEIYKVNKKRGNKFLDRFIDTIGSEHLSWEDIFDKKSFNEKNKIKIFNDLKESLPSEVIEKIGEQELYEFSEKYIGLLLEVNEKSALYKKFDNIIATGDEDKLYDSWNSQASQNIENSINLLNEHIGTSNNNTAVTTLSVGKIDTDFKSGVYDIAILDESSQTDIISAIPVLYRAKRAIIIGDEKQLFPIVKLDPEKDFNTFLAYDLDENDYHHYGYLHSSLLSVADKEIKKHNKRRTMLKEHFRCHPNIIGFSDRAFYDKNLRIKTKDEGKVGISWIDHNIDCEPKWKNLNEAKITIDIIEKYLTDKDFEPNQLGVVTPFREQANIITNLIAQKFGQQVGNAIIADTAHKFQGDERDIIIFSLVAGPTMRTGTYKWMQEGKSKNLINVAITRAKKELKIIGNKEHILEKGGLLMELCLWTDSFLIEDDNYA